ncbi:hypothetical protein FOQG_14844 [Fusarium oxysporum f. sp. raphani 54005]|uniref:Major facilitator superfamily (MFS) profile domain-containing protein n=2 Tax=Fusarium oxysporum f. sp. raphani TaxID=96318 RepID=X0BP03_FUSOX|nr:hypothetical protein FOQG_14844 [Fusarium oxysporum f. sp. raphani 54005]KAG7438428.1 Trichothecene efflux pump TRI12 [Fusarium oxysporum f. sp. raphani]
MATTSSQVEDPTIGEDVNDHFAWNKDVIANLFALYATYFASTWAMSVPNGSIVFILREYPQEQSSSAWISAGPSFALCVIQIFLGDISDIFGRKMFLLVGSLFGIIGLLVAATAKNVPIIIAGQVLNGVALTMGYLATPLLAEAVPKRQRAPVIGIATALVGIAGIGGNLSQAAYMKGEVGGLNKGWRIGFYAGAGLWVMSFVSVFFFYRPGPRPNPEGLSVGARLAKIDWLGILFGTSSLLFLLVGLQLGGQPKYPWDGATVIAFLVVGAAVLVVFSVWEWKSKWASLFPKSLFDHSNYSLTLVLNFIEGMVIFSIQAYIPQIVLSLMTTDYILSVVYNLPSVIFAMIAAGCFSFVASKTKEAKWVTLASSVALTLGTGFMALVKPNVHYMAFCVATALVGVGVGGLGALIPTIATLCTPNRYIATSVSIGTSIRGLGGAIGIVAATQIFTTKIGKLLPKMVAEASVAAGLAPEMVPNLMGAIASGDPALIQSVDGATPEVMMAVIRATGKAYGDSFRFVWWFILPFGVLAILGSVLLKSTKEQMTLQVASNVQSHYAVNNNADIKLEKQRDD